ncbi:PREDICTED: transcriptional regulatory protein SIN3-like [Dinoponera quadriceps]|uniref:Transcriptional regulatory protein SIN3-like n=1 Tax=Dinoponera quadriceps TaxID=609295 RepID=A0A6P3YDM8_DINQU|nr:PREDICTED: transcriptional regulatory protein SIN3-like [Dinoponera quadriceps]
MLSKYTKVAFLLLACVFESCLSWPPLHFYYNSEFKLPSIIVNNIRDAIANDKVYDLYDHKRILLPFGPELILTQGQYKIFVNEYFPKPEEVSPAPVLKPEEESPAPVPKPEEESPAPLPKPEEESPALTSASEEDVSDLKRQKKSSAEVTWADIKVQDFSKNPEEINVPHDDDDAKEEKHHDDEFDYKLHNIKSLVQALLIPAKSSKMDVLHSFLKEDDDFTSEEIIKLTEAVSAAKKKTPTFQSELFRLPIHDVNRNDERIQTTFDTDHEEDEYE